MKVLDFGLAKALEPVGAMSSSVSMSPTITTPAMTQMGMILGTAAYMSPEQAKGRAADKRSDVWAFGAVLFEMLTGSRAFAGDGISEVFASVLAREPNLTAVPDSVPARVRQVLKACFQKEPKQRVHDIADVRLALEGAFETAAPQVAGTMAVGQPAWRQPLPVAVSAAVVALLVAGLVAWSLWPSAEPGVVSRFDYELPENQAFRNTGRPVIAISPDARAFVYNATGGLYLRTIGELEARLMAGTEEGLVQPVFSPDGDAVAYFQGNQLKRVATSGGAPVVITEQAGVLGATWGADDTILFGQGDGIHRVPATGGTSELIIPTMEGERIYGPQLLPDGDSVLFSVDTSGNWDQAQIVVESLATGERTVLVEGGNDARYVPTGHLIYALGDGLFAVAFDPDSLTLVGGAVSLVQGVMRAGANSTGAANYGISQNGTLVYVTGSAAANTRSLVWVDREGREEEIAAEPSAYVYPRISPDATRVALDDRNADDDLWVWDFAAETRTRLIVGEAGGRYPVWTPDGDRIAYDDNTGNIAWKAANNTGTSERLAGALRTEGGGDPNTYFFAPTGTALVFRDQGNPDTGNNIGMIALEDGAEPVWLLNESFNERNAELSPNGRWMAYQSDESGENEIYVRPFPNVDDDRVLVSNAGGSEPLWSRDGAELFYHNAGAGADALMVAAVQPDGPVFSVDTRTPLLDWPYYTGDGTTVGRTYDVSPDGQRFLALRRAGADGTATSQIIVVQNWFSELERLVPVD